MQKDVLAQAIADIEGEFGLIRSRVGKSWKLKFISSSLLVTTGLVKAGKI
jgi:hypothetical protein